MKKKFMRQLDNNKLMNDFLINALEYEECDETSEIVTKLVSAEMKLSRLGNQSTYKSSNYRNSSFSTDNQRKKLRKKIFEELISNERLPNDDEISLGKGGALPIGKNPEKGKNAYLLIGSPASGKSSIATIIADEKKAVILDSDFAKRKFPEYHQDFGATLVHDESNMILFESPDAKEFSILQYCIAEGYNIIIPKIGTNKAELENLRDALREKKYKVHLTLISLDRVLSTKRAVSRFLDTGRYVPLSLIFDQYSNESVLTYYRVKNTKKWASIGKLSTNTPKGHNPIVIECKKSNPSKIFK